MSCLLRRRVVGFTLVELLIVVAIIGVLATIGVPTYRRMVQRAKKSEAKVNLGGLYTAEQAFFSEYGGYGNNVQAIGFDVDGSNMIYRVGFGTASCGNTGQLPSLNSGLGNALNRAYPQYYNAANYVWAMGRNLASGCLDADVNNDASSFIAMAAGAISPRVDPDNPGNGSDQWTINDRRVLSNFRDGVQ